MSKEVVLDACSGSRMMWFDKHDDRALFCDVRAERHTLCDGRELPKHARDADKAHGADHYRAGGAAYLVGVCIYKNPNQDRSTDGLRANWLWELGWRDAKAKQEEKVK